jgi:glycosyltransferase involved in cell wall biosynthesis
MHRRSTKQKKASRFSTRAENVPPSRRKRSGSDSVLISVVTAVRNGSDKIEKTIASVTGQDHKPIEYIIIDGGSTDGTLEKLKKHGKQIDFWSSEPDRGISDAFNKGIARAKGDLVGILNAGDWYEPSALSTVAKAYRSHPDVDVFCGSIRFWDHDSVVLHCYSNPELLERETSVYHPTAFIKRTAYEKYGVYSESDRYAMDYELLLRFKRQGAKFLGLAASLANMRLEGISSRHWYEGLKEVRNARAKYFPGYDVAYRHSIAVLKNVVARALKKSGFGAVYDAYWRSRNLRTLTRLRRDDPSDAGR